MAPTKRKLICSTEFEVSHNRQLLVRSRFSENDMDFNKVDVITALDSFPGSLHPGDVWVLSIFHEFLYQTARNTGVIVEFFNECYHWHRLIAASYEEEAGRITENLLFNLRNR